MHVELAVALDSDGVGHDGKLCDGGANITIAGDLERLLGEIVNMGPQIVGPISPLCTLPWGALSAANVPTSS